MNRLEFIAKIQEQRYCVIDFMPQQMSIKDNFSFFNEIELYFLEFRKRIRIVEQFSNIILKTLCYFDFEVLFGFERATKKEGFVRNCNCMETEIRKVLAGKADKITFLLPNEKAMIEILHDQLTIAVYNPSPRVTEIMRSLAISEGLFWWEPQQ
ncbi:MAG: hypothetical protein R3Y53_08245 [Bacillota bacterium]